MGVLLCANPSVQLWLNAVTARAERDVLQMAGGCDPIRDETTTGCGTLAEIVARKMSRGQMLRGPYWPRPDEGRNCSEPSLETWKHPLDVIANAWGRLLVLVGLRR